MTQQFITSIFIIEDDPVFGKVLKQAIEKEGDHYEVSIFQSGEEFFNRIHENPDIVSIDFNLPGISGIEILERIKHYNEDISTIFVSAQEEVKVVVEAYRMGIDRYLIKNSNALVEFTNCVKNLGKHVNLKKEVEFLKDKVIDRHKYHQIIGESPAILKVLRLIQKVENNNITVLVTGESGTGKELVASALHYNSNRRRKPFVPVNVAAIPEDLIESELFGHEKGAFTGASGKRRGKFEESNGGTIFLDEIGEMDLQLQSKLLRVLQESRITRLGSNKEIQLDLRIVAATNKNLAQRVREGKFREDLYYRLQGFLIHLPPLRERSNDVILLAKFFLQHFCDNNPMPVKKLSKGVVEQLLKHDWPGNVRELKAFIERAALLSDTDEIMADDLLFSQEF